MKVRYANVLFNCCNREKGGVRRAVTSRRYDCADHRPESPDVQFVLFVLMRLQREEVL